MARPAVLDENLAFRLTGAFARAVARCHWPDIRLKQTYEHWRLQAEEASPEQAERLVMNCAHFFDRFANMTDAEIARLDSDANGFVIRRPIRALEEAR